MRKGVRIMRSEREMLNLIVKVAAEDQRIRAVLLVGSRANPAAPKDIYQDYDITYFVQDVAPFKNNIAWIEEYLGKPILMQMPDTMELIASDENAYNHFAYLMVFEDGNRIDLTFTTKAYEDVGEPAIVLIDKDNFLPPLSVPTDQYWHIKPPTQKLFHDCCNEFWWCLNNIGKGIARDELPYAMKMFNYYVKNMLDQMIEWYIGTVTDFKVSAGKYGKYFKEYLPPEVYDMYAKTYSDGNYDNLWLAVYTACDLFRDVALAVAEDGTYFYNEDEEKGSRMYLAWIRDGDTYGVE